MDIGSWDALRTVCDADWQNNVVIGNVQMEDCRGIITLNAQKRTLFIKGTTGVIVVSGDGTGGWVLICKEDLAQAVKQVREKALGCDDSIVCEQCVTSAITVSGTNPLRVAAVGVTKAS